MTKGLSERIEKGVDYRADWAPLIASRVTATSESPITGAEILEWATRRTPKLRARTVVRTAALVSVVVVVMASIVLFVFAGNLRWFGLGTASPLLLFAALVLFAVLARQPGLRQAKPEMTTHYVVRQACLEAICSWGRTVYRWDDLRRWEVDETAMALVVAPYDLCHLLLRRQFSEAVWRRLREEALRLPEYEAASRNRRP